MSRRNNKAYQKEWYRKNCDRIKADRKQYRANNPDKVEAAKRQRQRMAKSHPFVTLAKNHNQYARNGGTVTPFELWRIAKQQKCRCPLTGERLTVDNISVDHIQHQSKGGLNVPSNIRLVTKRVNLARNVMTDAELYLMCKAVVDTLSPQCVNN